MDKDLFSLHTQPQTHTHPHISRSLWCQKCERCFPDATQLISHVKEQNCFKNENMYRCGTQDCSYQSLSGRSFLNHLLSFHKNNLFIFCYHCTKKFTLPHSLLLHMQYNCSVRNTNRGTKEFRNRIPSLPTATTAATVSKVGQAAPGRKPFAANNVANISTISLFKRKETSTAFSKSTHIFKESDSKLPSCPCCNFSVASGSVLIDHYIASHKNQENNSCLVCNGQFKNIDCFIKHFTMHEKNSMAKNTISETSDLSSNNECTIIKEIMPLEKKTHLSSMCVIQEEIITTFPYVCAVVSCKFLSFDAKKFSEHNDLHNMSHVCCYYCKSTVALEQLENHYRLHRTNNFQCFYCLYNSKTREEIRLHQSCNHADKAFKIYVRPKANSKARSSNNTKNTNTLSDTGYLPKKAAAKKNGEFHSSSLLSQRSYPQEQFLDKDIFCRMVSCKVECKNFDIYLNHLKEGHFAVNALCPYCSVVCEDSTHFENHILCHGPNLFTCPTEGCRLYSSKKSDVDNHVATVHKLQNNVKIIRENLDQKWNSLKINSKTFPKSKNKIQFYICPFCYYKNTSYKLMKNHIYAEFMYTRFQCSLCEEKLYSRSETKAHFLISHAHHNVKCKINNKPEIEFLTKGFLTPNIQNRFVAYLQYNRLEDDVLFFPSGYKCEPCELSFNDIADWHYHCVNCTFDIYKPYICNYCAERFNHLRNFKYHANKNHAGYSVNYTYTENAVLKRKTSRKLQHEKLKLFKDLLHPHLKRLNACDDQLKSFQFKSKYYKCGYCDFNDTFQCNVLKHILSCHKDKPSSIEKIKNSIDVSQNYNDHAKEKVNQNFDSNAKLEKTCESQLVACSSSDKVDIFKKKRPAAEDAYTFYYFPNPKREFSENDYDLFDCAYCNLNQKNIFNLKRHCINLHSGASFKVRGRRPKESTTVQCNYCDLKFMSRKLLNKHSLFCHPKMPLEIPKAKEEERSKRKNDDHKNEEQSSKILKENFNVYQCGYCQKLFLFYIEIIMHHKDKHPNLSLNINKNCNSKGTDPQLISCGFCPYLAEQKLMDNHIFIKHNNCYVCTYCGKAFDLTWKIIKHIKFEHKDLPVNLFKARDIYLLNSSTPVRPSATLCRKDDFDFSYYSTKPSHVDLNNIIVNIASNTSSNVVAQLPIVYFSQMFPIFPVVSIEDFAATSTTRQ